MAGTISSKFYWSDWRSDPGLRSCSLAARGLWMDMLCIAAEAQPTGYVLVNRRTLSTTDLARLTGAPEAAIQSALAELDAAGVFSRDHHGRIYSRRMVRDQKLAKVARKNGKLGGNPTLRKITEKPPPVNPPDKGEGYAPIPIAIKPYSLSQGAGAPFEREARAEARPPTQERASNGRSKPKTRISPDWQPDLEDHQFAADRGWDRQRIADEAEKFRSRNLAHAALYANWHAAWRNWVLRADDFAGRNGGGGWRPPARSGSIAEAFGNVAARLKMGDH